MMFTLHQTYLFIANHKRSFELIVKLHMPPTYQPNQDQPSLSANKTTFTIGSSHNLLCHINNTEFKHNLAHFKTIISIAVVEILQFKETRKKTHTYTGITGRYWATTPWLYYVSMNILHWMWMTLLTTFNPQKELKFVIQHKLFNWWWYSKEKILNFNSVLR